MRQIVYVLCEYRPRSKIELVGRPSILTRNKTAVVVVKKENRLTERTAMNDTMLRVIRFRYANGCCSDWMLATTAVTISRWMLVIALLGHVVLSSCEGERFVESLTSTVRYPSVWLPRDLFGLTSRYHLPNAIRSVNSGTWHRK